MLNLFHRRSAVHSYNKKPSYGKTDRSHKDASSTVFVIDFYLWIHGLGFCGNFRRNFRDTVKLLMSFLLLFIFECNWIYVVLHLLIPMIFKDGKVKRRNIFLVAVATIEWILRNTLRMKRKILILMAQRVFSEYKKIAASKVS